MTTKKTFDQITEILKNSDLSWLLPNLRQDLVVWNGLNDPKLFAQLLQSRPAGTEYRVEDFAPCRLALLALGQTNVFGLNPQNLFETIDKQIYQDAIRAFPELIIQPQHPDYLCNAGQIALALVNQFQINGSWRGLIEKLPEGADGIWLTAIACLFGLIEEPKKLLNALVQPGAGTLRYKLAVHAILSNPLASTQQISYLIGMCYGDEGEILPPTDRLRLIREIQAQNQQIAADFCKQWLDDHPQHVSIPDNTAHEVYHTLENAAEAIFDIQVHDAAGDSNGINILEGIEENLTYTLFAEMLNQIFSRRKQFNSNRPGLISHTVLLEHVIDYANNILPINTNPRIQSEMALNLYQQGYSEEALKLLPSINAPLPDNLDQLYSIALIYHWIGNDQQSIKAALRLFADLFGDTNIVNVPVWGEYLSLVNLGNLLVELHEQDKAARVFEICVDNCPNETNLLNMLAECYKSSNRNELAAETYCALVALNPDNLDFHRSFADSLAKNGQWEDCFEERSIIIDLNDARSQSPKLFDLYKYAEAALNANRSDLAVVPCTNILEANPEDSQAMIYLGQALINTGEVEKGINYLLQATQLSPQMTDAWLALAAAQKKTNSIKSVIDTLHSASLALPYSAAIHFSLGEAYLQDDSPTLAKPLLQRALDLSPQDSKILVRYGQTLKMLGIADEACSILAQAYNIDPNFPELAQDYARLLLDLGKIEEAIPPLDHLMNNKLIKDAATYMDYARCVLTANKRGSTEHSPMKALIALNEVVQIAPDIIEAKALIAEVLYACGENELAYQAYRDALDTPMRNDKAWFERLSYGLGCTAEAIGKYDVAIAALQEAAQTNLTNPEVIMALSNAYLSADLFEDAVREARNVLVLEGDNPDNLAWFARQMTKLASRYPQITHIYSGSTSNLLSSEILNALNKAIQMAPTRIDLVIQLGTYQSGIGAKNEAKKTFAEIAAVDFATISDLVTAAERLSELQDHVAAIKCLEKALSIDLQKTEIHTSTVYKTLAQEYFINHDEASALNILDKGIELIPTDISILSLKVEKLLEMGNPSSALNCIEVALEETKDRRPYLDLIFLACRINLSLGDLTSARKYARLAVSSMDLKGKTVNLGSIPFRYRIKLAELYSELLQPKQAYAIIDGDHTHNRDDFINDAEYLEYLFLRTELALESGKQEKATLPDFQIEPASPHFIRYAAQKASIMSRSGDYQRGQELVTNLIARANNKEQSPEVPSWEQGYFWDKKAIALCKAALDYGEWDFAIITLQQMIDRKDQKPLPFLLAAKAMILKAEYDQLCDNYTIIVHKPKNNALIERSYKICLDYLDTAEAIAETSVNEQIVEEYSINDEQIIRWRTRAAIAFEHTQELQIEFDDVLSGHSTTEDVIAVVRHLHRQAFISQEDEAVSKIIKIARMYPHDPGVILEATLALKDHSPEIAYRSLQSVVQENPITVSPTLAFCNILLAKIALNLNDLSSAKSAVEAALEFWPDEPAWQELAAQISTRQGEIQNAIRHLAEASKLSPADKTYHKQLGCLYLDHANDDQNVLYQALNQFEKALALDNDDGDVLINLATTQYLLGDSVKANENARKAQTISPDRVDVYQLLSTIAIQNNDYQGAYEYANKAILIDSKNNQSIVVLARSLSALGRYHEAIAKLNSAMTDTDRSEILYLERVNVLYKMAGIRAALNELVLLNQNYPNSFDILKLLAKMHVEAGENEAAISAANKALDAPSRTSSANEQANLHLLLGQLFRKSGELDLSIQHLSEAIRLAPDRLEPYLELGLARKERREYQQALQVFEQATSIAPDDPRALFQAGLALKESKDYKSSEMMLRRAVTIAPNDLSIRRQLAAVVALNLVHNSRTGRS